MLEGYGCCHSLGGTLWSLNGVVEARLERRVKMRDISKPLVCRGF